MRTIDLTALPGGAFGLDCERTCGNCRHRGQRTGKCRHVGSVCAGYPVGEAHPPCAWHRTWAETTPLPSPRQLMRAGESVSRITECNYPRGMEHRRGWTERAAGACGVRAIEAPRRIRALGYKGE